MISTIDQFFNDYRIQNNQFPNETVLNRGLMRLKREIRELKSLVDCLLGKEIEPWHEDKVYEVDEYVSYNGIIYRSNLDSNVAMNPQTSGFWDQQDIESVKLSNHAFKYIEYVSDGVQRKYETPFRMDSTPAVFTDGALLSPTKFTWAPDYIELNNPVGNQKFVTIIAGLSYDMVTVQPKQLFTAADNQWHFETRFQLSSPAVFLDGVYQASGYVFGANYIDFDDPVPDDTVVCVVNGTQGGVDLYSKQEMDEILGRYYTKDETYSRNETDSQILNAKNAILTDPTLAKQSETYTKTEVDTLLANIDVTGQIGDALGTKADKASTLAGYGIQDAYDKGTIDLKLRQKLNSADFNAENILNKIHNAEGEDTGLNADTLKGLKPEQFVRRDRSDHMTGQLTVKDINRSLELPATGDIQFTKNLDQDGTNEATYDFLNELNAKGSVIIVEGDFKGTWWDDIRNFGVLEPELYNWVVEVQPLFIGSQFDFVPKTYGDGFLFKAWKEEDSTGHFSYGWLDDNVVKLYSITKLKNGLFQDAPAHYVLRGYRKTVSAKFMRNQGDNPVAPSGFIWDYDKQMMSSGTPEVPQVEAPAPVDDNALEIITEPILHEADNTTNLIQTVPQQQHHLQWYGKDYMDGLSDYWIRVRGGVPNQVVQVKISNGSLITNASVFDGIGELFISIRGLDPFELAPTVTIESERCHTLTITPAVKP